MKNIPLIYSASKQIGKVSQRITDITADLDDFRIEKSSLAPVYQELVLDSLEELQKLTLEITRLISDSVGNPLSEEPQVNMDDSGTAFGPGELNYVKKDIPEEIPDEEDPYGST